MAVFQFTMHHGRPTLLRKTFGCFLQVKNMFLMKKRNQLCKIFMKEGHLTFGPLRSLFLIGREVFLKIPTTLGTTTQVKHSTLSLGRDRLCIIWECRILDLIGGKFFHLIFYSVRFLKPCNDIQDVTVAGPLRGFINSDSPGY